MPISIGGWLFLYGDPTYIKTERGSVSSSLVIGPGNSPLYFLIFSFLITERRPYENLINIITDLDSFHILFSPPGSGTKKNDKGGERVLYCLQNGRSQNKQTTPAMEPRGFSHTSARELVMSKTTSEASRNKSSFAPVAMVRTEAVVVAEVTNGRVYDFMRTPDGLVVSPVEDLSNINRWKPVESLRGFVSALKEDDFFRVQTTSQPNLPKPNLERSFFGRDCFMRSEFDLKWNSEKNTVEVGEQCVQNFSHLGVKPS